MHVWISGSPSVSQGVLCHGGVGGRKQEGRLQRRTPLLVGLGPTFGSKLRDPRMQACK